MHVVKANCHMEPDYSRANISQLHCLSSEQRDRQIEYTYGLNESTELLNIALLTFFTNYLFSTLSTFYLQRKNIAVETH